jgi:hypothetical protein
MKAKLMRRLVLVILLAMSSRADEPFRVSVEVNTGKVIRVMRGGIGASFHAIERPMLPHRPNGSMVGGSAWGANPAPDDDRRWREVLAHADWLGLDWCRVELEQRMYEPRRRVYDWDGAEMRILYRILDWAEKRGTHVFLQQMWGNVEWNAHPSMRGDHIGIATSGPHSMEDFAYSLGELLQHLTQTKGYKCIKWVSINNEPGGAWGWWLGPDRKPLSITPGLKAVRAEFDRRGLKTPLSGPDWTDLPSLDPGRIDFDAYIGAYDIHSYSANFDGSSGGYPLSVAEQRLREWADWAHSRGKPFFLSELGTMAYGWRLRDAGPSTYEALIKDAALVVRGIRAGVDAFNRWSFVNRGDLDGQWQLIDTWDPDRNRLLDRVVPHRNSYAMFGLLSRYTGLESSVVETSITGELDPKGRQVVAAALRSASGETTVMVVNESYRAASAQVRISQLSKPLRRYQVTTADRDRDCLRLTAVPRPAAFADVLPPLSITIYTTVDLPDTHPGIVR